MQTKFLASEYWLPFIICLLLVCGAFSSAFAQATQRSAVCTAEICFVKVTHEGFSPEKLLVQTGSTVVWKNLDNKMHTIVGSSSGGSSLFNSSLLLGGEDYAFTFKKNIAGEFTYYDQAENGKSGKILVETQLPENHVRSITIDLGDPSSGIKKIHLDKANVTAAAVIPEIDALSIEIAPSPNIDSVLNITVERRLLDSRFSGKDVPFSVLLDGKSGRYAEVQSPQDQRSLAIPVAGSIKNITIVGNQMSIASIGYEDALLAINQAGKGIAESRNNGVVPQEAENLLLKSTDAFEAGKYRFALLVANEAVALASKANNEAKFADQAIASAEASIDMAKGLNLRIPEVEQMLQRTKELYATGNYDGALVMAIQTKLVAKGFVDSLCLVIGLIVAFAVAGIAVYLFLKRWNRSSINVRNFSNFAIPQSSQVRSEDQQVSADPSAAAFKKLEESHIKSFNTVNLEKVFAEKPHLRADDRNVLRFIVERNGEALLAEIRNKFSLPKSTAWRLVKRLEREELVDIIKFGNQNLIRCRLRQQE